MEGFFVSFCFGEGGTFRNCHVKNTKILVCRNVFLKKQMRMIAQTLLLSVHINFF